MAWYALTDCVTPSTGKSTGAHVVQPGRPYDGARRREEERNGRPRAHIAAQRPTPRVSQIVIRDGDSFELALKRFSRRIQEAGILREVKRRRYYEPPSVKRKRKAQARVRKERKAAAKAAARGY
jgi:small subunit ribosomal protein S21